LLPVAIGLMQGRVIEIELVKPRTAKEALQQAYTKHFQEKDYQRAIEKYRWVVEKFPDSEEAAEALYRIGNIYQWELIEPEKAIECYNELISRYSDSPLVPEAMFYKGEIYRWSLKDIDKAKETYTAIIDKYLESPFSIKAKLRLGGILMDMKDLEGARRIYEEVMRTSEGWESEEASYWLGVIWLRQGMVRERALKYFEKALNYDTDHIECLYWAGYQIVTLCKCRGCLESVKIRGICEELIRRHRVEFPKACIRVMKNGNSYDVLQAQFYLGKFYFDEGEFEKAMDELSKILKKIPEGAEIYNKVLFYIAWIYAIKKRYSEAIKTYEEMLKHGEDKAIVLLNIALTYEEERNFAKAKKYYNEIIELYPETPEANEARLKLEIIKSLRY